MTPERWQQIEKLYHSALELDESRRKAFLDQACSGDQEVRQEVESLLAQEQQAESFIETPALGVAAKGTTQNQAWVGRQIGPYKVRSLLGAGGMGEVYLAQDPRLDRNIALKVLPTELASDPDRMRRFVREAKAASALKHPNVAMIFEIGESSGVHFIAMEYVEGQTLATRIGGRPLETAEILDIALQVADALDEAHGKRIIHRDIKPANLMLTTRDQVKVLDFGLAKITHSEGQPVASDLSTIRSTETGVVMGTAQYMSPEQVLGKKVDHRADIFSLGVVLYEMATGRLPFAGGSSSETTDRILHAQPAAIARFNYNVPTELERIVRKCLEKDLERRYQSARELLIDLKNLKRDSESPTGVAMGEGPKQAAPPVSKAGWRTWVPGLIGLAAVLLLLIGMAAWYQVSRSRSESSLSSPKTIPFTSFPGNESEPAFSPDGNQVAFVWDGENGDNYDIYVKVIDGGTPLRLTSNPAPESSPAWSPDGRRIAFLRRSSDRYEIFVISSLGGPERKLGQSAAQWFLTPIGLSWSADSKFLAIVDRSSPQDSDSIFLLSTETGEKRRLTFPSRELTDRTPVFSPDGHMLAFNRRKDPHYVGDIFLLAVSDGTATGEPRRLTFDDKNLRRFDWTPDGHSLVFSSNRGGDYGLWKIGLSGGEPQRLAAGGDNVSALSLSTQGHRLVYEQVIRDRNIWRIGGPGLLGQISTIKGSSATRLIASTKTEYDPQFSPEGLRIAFASNRSGTMEIWVCASDGSNPVPVTALGGAAGSPRWSPDGQQIVFDWIKRGTWVIYVVRTDGGLPRRLTSENSSDVRPSWSRDGRWIYFGSNRSGDWQVWKMPAEGGKAVQVTQKGGFEAFESPDGKWLYYAKYYGVQGIWKVPVAGGEEDKVLDHGTNGFWTVGKRGIFLLNPRTKSAPNIEFLGFATRVIQITKLREDVMFGLDSGAISVSPDARWILYASFDQIGSDLVLVENLR